MFSWNDVVAAARFQTKLWNIARFALIQLEKSEFDPGSPPVLLTDRWLLAELSQACSEVTAAMDQYQFDRALRLLREFSWNVLADNYIELAKGRLYGEEPERDGACTALRETLDALCRLLAPFAPHFAEEVFSRLDDESVHSKNWPRPAWHDENALTDGRLVVRLAAEIRRYKHEQGLALNAPMGKVTVFNAGIRDDGGDLSRALNAGIEWRQVTSALERRPGEVTFNMAEAPVHASLLVREHAVGSQPLEQPVSLSLGVAALDADQHEQAGADAAHAFGPHLDPGGRDPLQRRPIMSSRSKI